MSHLTMARQVSQSAINALRTNRPGDNCATCLAVTTSTHNLHASTVRGDAPVDQMGTPYRRKRVSQTDGKAKFGLGEETEENDEHSYEVVDEHTEEDLLLGDTAPICHEHGFFATLPQQSVPHYARVPFVHTGYRPTKMSLGLCLKSALTLNNDTLNIWTHLAGFVFFTLCQCYDNAYSLPNLGGHWTDHVLISSTLFCFQVCMLLSSIYHTFSCSSEQMHDKFLALDLMGITMAVLGFYLSGIFYGFYCTQPWRDIYIALFGILCIGTLALPIRADYTTPQFAGGRLAWHHIVYISIVLYGVLPTVHWVWLHGGSDSPIVQRFMPNVLVLYVLLGAAFAVYAFSVPERFQPGKFDLIGWSHQWWHVLIFMAMLWWRSAGLEYVQFNLTKPCHKWTQ